jgi:hypothetical protein
VISKKKIATIVKILAQNEDEKISLLFYTSVKNLNLNISSKENLVIIFSGKYKILNFIKFSYHVFFHGIKFQKNIFLLFNLKNQLVGHNFIPDWPGIYCEQSFGKNMFVWLKKIIYIFLFKKKLLIIFTKIN